MDEPSEPVAYAKEEDIQALTSRIKRLEARVGAYEAFLETWAQDARYFANAQKKALLDDASVKP